MEKSALRLIENKRLLAVVQIPPSPTSYFERHQLVLFLDSCTKDQSSARKAHTRLHILEMLFCHSSMGIMSSY